MSIDMAQFHQAFFEESFEGLEVLEQGLLTMDPGAVDAEGLNAIFRAAHSIKGGSGTFGFQHIADFTHVLETLLDQLRDGRRRMTVEAVAVLLKSVDVLQHLLTTARDGGDLDQVRVDAQRAELESLLAAAHCADPGQGDAAETPCAAQRQPGTTGWHIAFRPHAQMLRSGNDPLRVIRALAGLGDLDVQCDAARLPAFADYDPEGFYLSWDLRFREAVEQSAIAEIFAWVEDDCDFAITPIHGPVESASLAADLSTEPEEPAAEAPVVQALPPAVERRARVERRAPDDRRKSPAGGANSIRVDTQKIDALINMVGELVITQSMLSVLGNDFDLSRAERLRDGLAQLERHTRGLQEGVMQIRMLPISVTFNRFPRLVHDLSTKLGKKIRLELTGDQTEVDKAVIEKISDPLVHLVRNSLDHGIEMPQERLAAGKSETGTVQLNAFHHGGNIVIEIRDNGRGLDLDRIRSKAVDRGLVSPEDALTDQQILDLIFQPGFSTAEQVSEVSGRGVGMDVVRRNINELGGSIEIESAPGKGSAISIRLPLTLAILDGQTIGVGDETYIVPLVSIVESTQVRADRVHRVAGQGETFRWRDEYLPVRRLHELFGIARPRAKALNEGLLVVVEGEGRRCGLFVDDLLGQQQVVIKSLEANYHRVEGISGATILGDGTVALILDIPSLMRLGAQCQRPTRAAPLALSA